MRRNQYACKQNLDQKFFQNDLCNGGESPSKVVYNQIDESLKSLFQNFGIEDFRKFICLSYQVLSNAERWEASDKNKLLIQKNVQLAMAGLDVLDSQIRHRVYLGNRDMKVDAVLARLKQTAQFDSIVLFNKEIKEPVDLGKVFPFKSVRSQQADTHFYRSDLLQTRYVRGAIHVRCDRYDRAD